MGTYGSIQLRGKKTHLNLDAGEIVLLGVDQAIPCCLVLHELVSNSLQHASPSKIEIKTRLIGDEVELVVADDGQGMPEGFDFKQSETLGLQLTKGLIERQLHGTWDIMSSSKAGTKHTIRFKKAD